MPSAKFPGDPAESEQIIPITEIQRGMWLRCKSYPLAAQAYLLPFSFRLEGQLDVNALRLAFDDLLRANDGLRSSFPVTGDGSPVCRIGPASSASLEYRFLDLSSCAEKDRRITELAAEDWRRPFDLDNGPLLRTTLIRESPLSHVLMVMAHHIVIDGPSLIRLSEQLALHYNFRVGQADEPPPMASMADWMRDASNARSGGADDIAYWREYLAGISPVHGVPTDRPRPAVEDATAGYIKFGFNRRDLDLIKAGARSMGVSTYTLMVTAWAVMLARLGRDDHAVVGVPFSRHRGQVADTPLGCLIDMLPIRIPNDPDLAIHDLLGKVQASVRKSMTHGALPLDRMMSAAGIASSPAHHPVYQTCFTLPKPVAAVPRFAGLRLSALDVSLERAMVDDGYTDEQREHTEYSCALVSGTAKPFAVKMDITILVLESSGCLHGGIEFAAALWDESTVRMMADGWRHIALAMAQSPAKLLGAIDWGVRDPLLPCSVSGKADAVQLESPASALRRWATIQPDADALLLPGRRISFGALEQHVDAMVEILVRRGVSAGARIAYVGHRGPMAVILFLAALRRGACFVPLDASQPPARLAALIDGCDPRLVAGHCASQRQLTQGRQWLAVGEPTDPDFDDPANVPRPDSLPPGWESLPAYVFHTSGSTGAPKGVEVSQGALARCRTTLPDYCDSGPGHRVLQAANITFDVFVLELLMSICQGAALCLPDRVALAGESLAEALDSFGITHALLTPSTLASLGKANFPLLQTLLCGAEPLPADLARRWMRGRKVFNCYGPTEATIIATAFELTEPLAGNPPIGRVLGQHRGYVLDPHGHPLPPGAVGELYLGGDALATGYLGSERLTRQRFVADPFSANPDARMYRTGDLVRARQDGALLYQGRADDQIKINGVRVEPKEVESHLASLPGIRDVHVRAVEFLNSPRLVAYVTAESHIDEAWVKARLRESLPLHLVPSHVIQLTAFPRLPNGKMDPHSLPVPQARPADGGAEAEGPTESLLAGLWSTLLGLDRVGRDDHFFDLGGHSLLAVQVIARVRQALGVDIALADLFAHPILADFAACLDRKQSTRLPEITPVARDAPLPLSFAQQRLWFLAQLGENASRAYHMPLGLDLRGSLDQGALQRALDRLVERHEALRTHFGLHDGAPVQVISPPRPFALHEHDLRGHPDPLAAARQLAAEEADQPFDLASGPLIRGRLLRLADDHHHLLLTQHHILSDGWSMGVLGRELRALYDAFAQGRPDPLPALPIQYADYAVWQRQHVSGERLQAQADYWRRQLADAPARLALPTDRPRQAEQDFRGGAITFALDAELTAGLRRLGQRHGTTLFQTLLASWALLLSRLSGQDDLVIGTPTANRDHGQTQGLVGFFVNTLPLRIDLSGEPTVAELLARTKTTALEALAHQDIPFEQIVDLLGIERNLSHNPLFQVAFALQNAPMDPLRLSSLSVGELDRPDHRTAIFDLSMHLREVGHGLEGLLEYATSPLDPGSVERILEHWRFLLSQWVVDATASVRDLRITPPDEERLIVGWTRAGGNADPQDVVARILAHASRNPDGTALLQNDESTSYAELVTAASVLAEQLRLQGAGPGTRVALCLSRTPALPTAMLAVMMTGAAYVPIDPDIPAARLGYYLEDSHPIVVVADPGLALPPGSVPVIRMAKQELASMAACPGLDSPPPGDPERIAYVIYTSGSAGRPKGVQVGCRGLANLVAWHIERFAIAPGDYCSAMAGLGFDAFAWEVWPVLAAGATLLLPDPALGRDPGALLEWWSRAPLDVSFLPTPLAELAFRDGPLNSRLRTLLVGGDKLRHLPKSLPFELVNNYGPTETTVVATSGKIEPGVACLDVGRPIANTRIEVLDPLGHRVPIGVSGEIFIGGHGVAKGYLDRPELNAKCFVQDPFDPASGSRLYRTGDIGRWLPDGRLDVLGRTDFQVKIRGYRIEPAEIEAVIRARPGVDDALVIPVGSGSDRRLVAFVQTSGQGTPEQEQSLASSQVTHWQTLYDANYADSQDPDSTEDFTGWNSSFTGRAIPEEHMRAWRDETLSRIRALRPRRILEIGCGSGLLLFPLVPEVDAYVATDISGETLARIQAKICRHGYRNISLRQQEAADFTDLGTGYDLVLINSVAQYFPSGEYLRQVLDQALEILAPDGAIFLGDLRHHGLLASFHVAIQASQSEGTQDFSAVANRAASAASTDKELLVDPCWVRLWATGRRVPGVSLLPKQSPFDNELTAYRYDAVLSLRPPRPAEPEESLHWKEMGLCEMGLEQILSVAPPQTRLVEGIPNRPLQIPRALEALSGSAPASLSLAGALEIAERSAAASQSSTPARIVAIAGTAGYQAILHWEGQDPTEFSAMLVPAEPASGAMPAFPLAPAAPSDTRKLVNAPLKARRLARIREELQLATASELPEYMRPAQWLLIDAFPYTSHGKVDRKALEMMARPVTHSHTTTGLSGPTESLLAGLWSTLLGLDRVGRDDHFFDLGGHSLLAVQVIARVRQALGVDIALADLFAHPILADFAACLDRKQSTRLPEITPVARDAPLPLSFAQQRLWFLAQLGENASRAYHMPLGLDLRGSLDQGALQRALDRLVERHEALRTHFGLHDGAPVQVISPPRPFALHEHDLRGHPDPLAAARQLAAEEADQPFDLASGPLIRGRLLRLADDHHHLLLTQHHILSDGWSMGVLGRELRALYDAFAQGRPDPLPALPIQYADYAVWQRQHVSGERLQAQADYWRRQLADAPARLALPTDRPRQAEQDFRGGAITFALDAELTAGLRRLGQRHGTTLFQTLLASWALLLSRLSGQDDLVIGTPTANRDHGQTQGLVGFFVNTLPLRIDLSGEPTVAELLARTKTTALEALAHQDIPFEQIVDLLGIERNLSHNPLFQVAFAFLESQAEPEEADGFSVATLPPPDGRAAAFDLVLSLEPSGAELDARIFYAHALLDASSVQRIAGMWQRLVSDMVDKQHMAVHRLRLLNDEMISRIAAWSGPGASPEAKEPAQIHARILSWAERSPDAPAVQRGGDIMSYRELAARASGFAGILLSNGVKAGDVVAIQLPKGPELPVAILGCLMAGGVYCPLDDQLPPARKQEQMEDSAPRLLVVAEDAGHPTWAKEIPVLRFGVSGRPPAPADLPPMPLQRAENAYLIFTSGSTGRPKGVMTRHSAVLRTVADNAHLLDVDDHSRILQIAQIGFDMSIFDFVLALCSGACLCLPAARRPPIGEDLIAEIRESRASHACMTPSILATLDDGTTPDALKTIIIAGEPATTDLVRRWAKRLRLVNMYGPTEAAIATTWHVCSATEEGPVAIGRPLPGVSCQVLDKYLQPVPDGVAGELFIGNVAADGYLNRPEMTAQKFIAPMPDGSIGKTLFRTGDIVRRRPDGDLVFIGRLDSQIKLRGLRIDLAELEGRLRKHPFVIESVVVPRADANGEEILVAYVTLDPASPKDDEIATTLHSFLAQFVPHYMIPSAFVRMPCLPLSPNGKLDAKALPAPGSAAFARAWFESPAGELESRIAAIWGDILGRDNVGRHDNFFHTGGNSLLLLRLAARLAEAGLSLPLPDLYRHPTISQMAARIANANGAGPPQGAELVRAGKDACPAIYFFPDGLGMTSYALEIIRLLKDIGSPVFLLHPPREGEQDASLGEVAGRMAGLIAATMKSGPVHLVGWSFGGLLAYETAARLSREGTEVGALVMVDSHVIAGFTDLPTGLPVTELAGGPEGGGAAPADAALRFLAETRFPVLARDWSPGTPLEATLIEATGSRPRASNSWAPTLAWSRLTVIPVDGDHFSMLRPPHLALLATRLETIIANWTPQAKRA